MDKSISSHLFTATKTEDDFTTCICCTNSERDGAEVFIVRLPMGRHNDTMTIRMCRSCLGHLNDVIVPVLDTENS